MSNKLIEKLKTDYMETGLSRREALNEAVETYKQIRGCIMGGEDARTVLADYGLGDEFLEDVL